MRLKRVLRDACSTCSTRLLYISGSHLLAITGEEMKKEILAARELKQRKAWEDWRSIEEDEREIMDRYWAAQKTADLILDELEWQTDAQGQPITNKYREMKHRAWDRWVELVEHPELHDGEED
jgi:hypothetical protein